MRHVLGPAVRHKAHYLISISFPTNSRDKWTLCEMRIVNNATLGRVAHF